MGIFVTKKTIFQLVLVTLFVMAFVWRGFLPSSIKWIKNYVNMKDASFGCNCSGFSFWSGSWGCKVSNVLIQKSSCFLRIFWITSVGLFLFVIVWISVNLALVLKSWLLWTKWWQVCMALGSYTSDRWLFKRMLN